MSATRIWWWFWTVCFVIGGASFSLITAVVLFKGVGDLRQMVRRIRNR
jgi:hypothetical protein